MRLAQPPWHITAESTGGVSRQHRLRSSICEFQNLSKVGKKRERKSLTDLEVE